MRKITIIAIAILLFGCKNGNHEEPRREESLLIDLGKRYYKEKEDEMKRIEKIFEKNVMNSTRNNIFLSNSKRTIKAINYFILTFGYMKRLFPQ